MYQRTSPASPSEVSDMHAVVKELADVLTRQRAPEAASAHSSRMATATAAFHGDDAEMPIPSTWKDPHGLGAAPLETAPWRTGLLGLFVGLCLTMPTVLWLTGHLSAPLAWLGIASMERPAIKAEGPVLAAEVAWPVSAGRGSAEPVASDGSSIPPAPGADSPAGVLTTAELLISGGDIVLARSLLERNVASGHSELLFALAETYDPNLLAAWGVRDLRADPGYARSLYERALAGGVDKARNRIQGLQ